MSERIVLFSWSAVIVIISGCIIADYHFSPNIEKKEWVRTLDEEGRMIHQSFPFVINPLPSYRSSFTTEVIPKLLPPSIRIKPATAHKAWKKARQEALFDWPLESTVFWISSQYGRRKNPEGWGFHAGIDMAAPKGTPVYAAQDGIIGEATYSPSYGKYIILEHESDYKTRYAHLDKILVASGSTVNKGDLIGRVGATGAVRKSRWGRSASHLHFEVYAQGKTVNPFCFLI